MMLSYNHYEFSWCHVFIPTQTNLADFTGNHWVTCFQETAELLLKITADELGQMRDSVSKTRCFVLFCFFFKHYFKTTKGLVESRLLHCILKVVLIQFEFAIDFLVLDLLNNAILCRKTFVQYCILNVTSYYYFFLLFFEGGWVFLWSNFPRGKLQDIHFQDSSKDGDIQCKGVP